MPNYRKILSITALTFAVATGSLFLVDVAQRTGGNLRAKVADSAHVQLAPAYTHDVTGQQKTSFKILEPVFTHEHYRKVQACHLTLSNVFINQKTKFLYRGDSYLTWVREGDFEISEQVALPVGITPGTYRFIRKTVSFCGGETVYYTTNFDMEIEITGP
jgi:hypothetical protein